MSFKASIITLYPEMFPGPLGVSLAGRALNDAKWSLETIPLRKFGEGKHSRVDDTPAGGGAGMVLKADVLAKAIDSTSSDKDTRPRLLMSPRGRPLTQTQVRDLANGEGVVLICGRFEGVDERVIEARNLTEVSIGDYILSGGEPAAIVMLDAIIRLLPGVMGNDTSGESESFETGLLEHPHYTRPQDFEGLEIPEVLTSGNHKRVEEWQRGRAEELTRERRPDLLPALSDAEIRTITKLEESLWIAESRYDDEYMDSIFADEFIEIGRSGKVYSRGEMFFGGYNGEEINCEIPLQKFRIQLINLESVVVTYCSKLLRGGVRENANRSSIWRRTEGGNWKLVFHQGTPIEKES